MLDSFLVINLNKMNLYKSFFFFLFSIFLNMQFWPAYADQDSSKIDDIGLNPKLLFNREFNPKMCSLFGVKFGDDENILNTKFLILYKKDAAGWIYLRNGGACRISEGKIVEFMLTPFLTHKLGITNRDEIINKLGKPDYVVREKSAIMESANKLVEEYGKPDKDEKMSKWWREKYFYLKKALIMVVNQEGDIGEIYILKVE